jgi:tetratricopeptide (TPR) repeat protein
VLIIDNADETSLFEPSKQGKQSESQSILEFIPESQRGVILITTRNRAAGVKFTKGAAKALIEVKPMTSEEAKVLIKSNVTDQILEEDELDRLSELLGHLPLAIVQAAAFMQENSMSVSEYIELYNDSEETSMDLLCEPFETLGRDTGVPNAVATTLIVSLDQIKERDPKALEILQLIPFLDRNEVPKSLVHHRIKRPLELTKALGTLKAFSLIVPTNGKGDFSFHRLVQLVLRKWLILESLYEEKSVHAMELLDEVYPDATFENWGTCAAYLPHAQSVLSLVSEVHDEGRKKRIHLQEGIAYYLWSQGYYQEAEKLDALIVEEKKRELGPEHPETLESMTGLAATYHDQAKWAEAEQLDSFVLEARRKTLGSSDRLTLTTMSNLATTYVSQDRMQEAEALRREVYETSKSEFGEEDEDTIIAMTNLGTLYISLGKVEEAADLIQRALAWRKKTQGSEHKDTLVCSSTLAKVYKAQGKLQEAEELALQCLTVSEAVLGPQHPETWIRKTIVADIYLERGKLDMAEEQFVQMIEEMEKEKAPRYDILERILRLAGVYRAKGDEKMVVKLEGEALDGSIQELGPDHPFTMRCLYFVAVTHKQYGRDAEAIRLMTLATHREEKNLGPYHDSTLESFHMLREWCGDDVAIQKLLEMDERGENKPSGWEGWTTVGETWK